MPEDTVPVAMTVTVAASAAVWPRRGIATRRATQKRERMGLVSLLLFSKGLVVGF
jgi:hypothetical protein